jgi:hypothetical protein
VVAKAGVGMPQESLETQPLPLQGLEYNVNQYANVFLSKRRLDVLKSFYDILSIRLTWFPTPRASYLLGSNQSM